MYFRLRITSGNAAGHNMTTKAADAIIQQTDETISRITIREHLWKLLYR